MVQLADVCQEHPETTTFWCLVSQGRPSTDLVRVVVGLENRLNNCSTNAPVVLFFPGVFVGDTHNRHKRADCVAKSPLFDRRPRRPKATSTASNRNTSNKKMPACKKRRRRPPTKSKTLRSKRSHHHRRRCHRWLLPLPLPLQRTKKKSKERPPRPRRSPPSMTPRQRKRKNKKHRPRPRLPLSMTAQPGVADTSTWRASWPSRRTKNAGRRVAGKQGGEAGRGNWSAVSTTVLYRLGGLVRCKRLVTAPASWRLGFCEYRVGVEAEGRGKVVPYVGIWVGRKLCY